MSVIITRRQAIQTVSSITAVGVVGNWPVPTPTGSSVSSGPKKRVLRIAHLTDIHVQPERRGGEGMAACLHHVQELNDKPDVVFNGGDSIMDAFEADRARTQLQWDLWHKVLRSECALSVEHCLGNHDVWGWNQSKSLTTGKEAGFGKQWALDAFGMTERYRSFDRAGWHFIVLDSTHRNGQEYLARLDDQQWVWLQADLKKVPSATPILILSHIPILCACVFFDGDNEKTGDWQVPRQWMHIDARRIKDLLQKYVNVKLCLSGHVHLQDQVIYNGITYVCNGAVCGDWWKGAYQECEPGYGLVDLYADGTFANQYITYGWKGSP